MIADVIGDVYGEEEEYGEEAAGFKRENEGNYDFMWTSSSYHNTTKESSSYFRIYAKYNVLVKNLFMIKYFII